MGTLTYAVTTGSLPAGITMSSAGELSGTPTATGTSDFTVTASDVYGDSNSQSLSIVVAAASGSGSYEVTLTWDAPSSSTDPVAGYNIYRAPSGSTAYTRLNSTANAPTTFTDSTATAGASYSYFERA